MNGFENDIEQCLATLRKGGLILYPTDTVWGIGCDATHAGAVEKIYALKNRPGEKAMIVLVADERAILQHTAAPDLAIFDYLEQSKRPTTVIYEGAIGLADNLAAPDGSIAIRICEEPFCKQLIKRFRKPIVSTSANLSGQPAPRVFSEISEAVKNGVDYIVQYRQDDVSPSQPSLVIKWEGGKPIILRG